MLLIKTLSFAAVAVAFHPDLAELFPRQTAVNNGDPCYTKVQSLYDSQPTLGPAYSSWASSIYATVTDNCTAFEITGTALSVVASWRDEMGDWRVSHSSEIRSLSSECSSYMKSRADAALASVSSYRESCRDKTRSSTRTRSRTTTPGSSSITSSSVFTPSDTTSTTTTQTEASSTSNSGTAAATTTTEGNRASGISPLSSFSIILLALFFSVLSLV